MDLKEESILGGDIDSHWYYLSKARALSSCLPRSTGNKVLDVGAGSGFFSRWLLSHGLADEATCVDTGYASDCDEALDAKPLRFRREIASRDAPLLMLMYAPEPVEATARFLRAHNA